MSHNTQEAPPYNFYAQNPAFKALVDADQQTLTPWRNWPAALARLSPTTADAHQSLKRICKELASCAEHPAKSNNNTTLAPIANDPRNLLGAIAGPPATPYEGGVFFVRVVLPLAYPRVPPVVRFLTPLRHPNVDADGSVAVDVLAPAHWSPVVTVPKILLLLSAVLDAPDLEAVVAAEVARELVERPDEYRTMAAQWTLLYATGVRPAEEVLTRVIDEEEEDGFVVVPRPGDGSVG